MSEAGAPPADALRLLQDSQFEEARALLSRHCQAQPCSASGWFLLGAACHQLGDLHAALTAFARACDLSPGFVQAWNGRAAVQLAIGLFADALASYRRALALAPTDPQLWTNAAIVLGEQGEWGGAFEHYEQALARDAAFGPALMNRGFALAKLGRLEEALASHQRFAALNPGIADAHFNCAEALLALSRFDEAVAAADLALRLEPNHAAAYFDRGLALACLGRVDNAQAAFAASRTSDPQRYAALCRSGGLIVQSDGVLDGRVIYLVRLMARAAVCDWRRQDELIQSFATLTNQASDAGPPLEAPELLFSSLSVPVEAIDRLKIARMVAAGFERRRGSAEIQSKASSWERDRSIRIGYVSPDFRIHAVGLLIRDLLNAHDRGCFEVFAYAVGPDDASEVRRHIAAATRLCDVSDLNDHEIARRIAHDGIDILVDLAGYTELARSGVFAKRPAAIQVNYLGYAGTLGAAYIDYAIVDAVTCPPGSDRWWTEKLVRLPSIFSPSGSADVPVGQPLARAQAGFPEAGFVFCCFANNYKIDPTIFDVWMRILRRVPDACLWLTLSAPESEANLRREAQARGVDPARIVFAPRVGLEDYLARYRLADLFLDTRWFNAHTTAIDALRHGVPVLTVAGEGMASRLGASVLSAAGLPELITRGLEEYEARAVELATQPHLAVALRAKMKLTVPGSALFDTKARARELEAAYTEMVSRRRRGLPPESFAVKAKPVPPAWF